MFGGETTFKLGYAAIDDEQVEREDEYAVQDEELEAHDHPHHVTDNEVQAALEHKLDLGGMELEFGVQYSRKDRDTDIQESEPDDTIENVTAFRLVRDDEFEAFEPVDGGINTIEETRIDPYVMLSGGKRRGEVGGRSALRNHDTTITDETVDAADRVNDKDYGILLPSASARFQLTEDDRIVASVAPHGASP